MQAITPALTAILKDHFQAGASGFRGRVEVDAIGGWGAVNDGSLWNTSRAYGAAVTPFCDTGQTSVDDVSVTGGDADEYRAATFPATVIGVPGTYHRGWEIDLGQVMRIHVLTEVWFPAFPGGGARPTFMAYSLNGSDWTDVASPWPTADDPLLWEWEGGYNEPDQYTWEPVVPVDARYIRVWQEFTNPSGFNYWDGCNLGELLVRAALPLAVAPASYQPKRISIDKSLRMTADQATIEFANEDLPLGWGPDSLFPTNSRCRVYQWYGDNDNEVLTFTGLVDAINDSRDPLTTAITCRDMMALLLDQTFGATAPQSADETGNARTEANGVYLSREVSYIVADILDRAGWPTAARAITPTSYVLDEFVISDGTSWAEAIIGDAQLTGLVGYDAWADEAGVFHFAPTFTAGALTEPGVPAYTFTSGVDILSLQDAIDQYELRTRVKVRGPLTTQTLTDTWRELWRTSKLAKPVGIWYDPSDSANIRVLDRGTKRLYKLRQSDRAVLSSVNIGAVITYPLGISGDPSDATIYWVLNGPWLWTPGTSQMVKVRKSDNHVLARYNLDGDHWSSIKVSGAYIYMANLTDDRVYRRSKTTGAAVDSFRHTYNSVAQSNPSGVMIDGTTINVFWSNSGTTARFLQSAEAAPGTVTKVVKTAGTALVGGEMDTTTHTECWGGSDSLGLVAKFTLIDVADVTNEVYAEVVDTELEHELGELAQSELRQHDTHTGDADHAFEVRRDTLDVTVVTSLAQATQTAMRRLDKLSQRRRVLDIGIIGNPALQKTDLVRVEDPVTGIAEDWSIDTYRSEMAADSTYLGTLALIPVETPDDDPTDDGDATE